MRSGSDQNAAHRLKYPWLLATLSLAVLVGTLASRWIGDAALDSEEEHLDEEVAVGGQFAPPKAANGTLLGRDPGRESLDGAFHAQILIDPEGRRLTFWWRRKAGFQLGNEPQTEVQEWTLWYWPNLAEWVSETRLLVAGISPRDGKALVEIWEFDGTSPEVHPFTDPTGVAASMWRLPQRSGVDLVWKATESGMGPIGSAIANRALAGRALVRFEETGEIFDLDTDSGAMTLVASANGGAPMVIPELVPNDLRLGTGVDHATDGFVYFAQNLRSGSPLNFVFLIDQDRDGSLDRYETPSTLADPNRYLKGPDVLEWF